MDEDTHLFFVFPNTYFFNIYLYYWSELLYLFIPFTSFRLLASFLLPYSQRFGYCMLRLSSNDRTIYPSGLNKRVTLKFQHISPEEGRSVQWPGCCEYTIKISSNDVKSVNSNIFLWFNDYRLWWQWMVNKSDCFKLYPNFLINNLYPHFDKISDYFLCNIDKVTILYFGMFICL